MIYVSIVGVTGKLGRSVLKSILQRDDIALKYAIARKGNQYVGQSISTIIDTDSEIKILDDISEAADSDVFIDCTNAETFIQDSMPKYKQNKKPVIIATTAFSENDKKIINELSAHIPVFMSGNFSITLHNFIETLKFAVKKVDANADIQILEYHHNQKKDAPSGTALMIKEALIEANTALKKEKINICNIRGGNIFGEHEVIIANSMDEIVTYKHSIFSRESLADGAIKVAVWIIKQEIGLYNMDDFCKDR